MVTSTLAARAMDALLKTYEAAPNVGLLLPIREATVCVTTQPADINPKSALPVADLW